MSGDYLLDTNIVIYAINEQLTLPEAAYSISVITEMELLSFPQLSKQERFELQSLFEQMTIFPLEEAVKEETIETKRLTGLKLPDSIISATARVSGKCLVTNDGKLLEHHRDRAMTLQELLQ